MSNADELRRRMPRVVDALYVAAIDLIADGVNREGGLTRPAKDKFEKLELAVNEFREWLDAAEKCEVV